MRVTRIPPRISSRLCLFLVALLVGCDGLGGGCGGASGCDTTIETDGLRIGTDVGFPRTEALSNTAGITITDEGFTDIEERGLEIIATLLEVSPESLDLSDLVNDYLADNPVELFDWSIRDVEVIASLPDGNASVSLTVLPEPTRLRIEISRLWVSVSATVFDDQDSVTAACNLAPDGDVGTAEPQSLIFEDIVLDVILDTTNDGNLALSTDIIDLGLVDTGIHIVNDESDPRYYCELIECQDGSINPCAECVLFCEGGELLVDLGEFFADLLADLVGELAEDAVNAILEGVQAIEGAIHPALLLGELSPPLHDAEWLQFRLSPGSEGFAAVPIPGVDTDDANDLFLSFAGGTYAELHPCVIKTEGEPTWSPPAGYRLDPGESRPDLVLSLADTFLDQALWSIYKSGSLCLSVDSQAVSGLTDELELNAGLLSLLLPGLESIAEPDAPLLITLRPNIDHGDFPLISLGDPDEGASLVSVVLGSVDIGLYTWVQGRYLRLFEVRTRLDLGVTPMVLPDNALQVTIDSLDAELEAELYNELFVGVDLTELVNFVLEVVTGLVADGGLDLSFSLDELLSDLFGLPLRLVIDRLETGGPESRWIELAVRLDDTSVPAAMRSVETIVTVADVGHGWLELDVTAPGFDRADIEYQVRWEGGFWSGFQPATERLVESSWLRLPGPRTIEIRARHVDDYRSLDPSPSIHRIERAAVGVDDGASATESSRSGQAEPVAGCVQAPGSSGPGSWLAGLALGLFVWRRRVVWQRRRVS